MRPLQKKAAATTQGRYAPSKKARMTWQLVHKQYIYDCMLRFGPLDFHTYTNAVDIVVWQIDGDRSQISITAIERRALH